MQVTLEANGTHGKTLRLTWTPDEIHARRSQVLRKLGERVKLPGFRPGRTSQSVIEKRFGAEASAQVEEELANEGLKQAVSDHQLKPIGPVKHLDSDRVNGLKLGFAFEVRPSVTLPDPKSLNVPKEEISIPDKEVDDVLGSLGRRAGTLTPLAADETILADDSVTLTGKVLVGSETARELHDFHHLVGAYPLLGKQPEEVLAAFKDKGAGAVVELTTTLPATFAPTQYAGKEATVSVTIQTVSRNRAPALDDDFAKKMGLESLPKLREAVLNNLKSTKENALHTRQLEALTKELLAKVSVDLPPELRAQVVKNQEDAAAKAAEAEKKEGSDIEKARTDARTQAEESLKRYIVLAAISDAHNVQVTREDVEQQMRMAAMRSGQTPDAIQKRLAESGRVNEVLEEIREAKALETLLELALKDG